jgi:hypothetical protein
LRRPFAALLLLAPMLLASGCASLFSGRSQRITVETNPPGALVVVLDSPAAPILLTARRSSDLARRAVGLLAPFLSDEERARLSALELDELVTRLVGWARLDMIPPELAGADLSRVPPALKGRLLSFLGVAHAGPSPAVVKLKKGRQYAVLAWQPGHGARMAAVEMKFNFVTLLNVFNAFLGVPIDMLTGAWFNLKPSRLELTLPLRGA